MRLWLPSPPSLRMQFSNRFQNLSYVLGGGGMPVGPVSIDRGADLSGGGYIVFGARGADSVWQLPWWSVMVDLDVPAAGSERMVLACAHPVTGGRFGLGFSATGTMQLIGASTVQSDDTVSAGRHKCLWIFTGGVVEFWCDGVRIGTATVSLSTGSPNTLFVGVAGDGVSLKLGTTIYKLDVYSYPLDENEAFGVSAVEGWTPKNLLSAYGGSYDDGLYWDGDEDGAYELNTQPVLLDGGMEAVGFAAYAPLNSAVLSKQGGAYAGAQCLRVAWGGATNPFAASTLGGSGEIAGNRYTRSIARRADGSGFGAVMTRSSGALLLAPYTGTKWQYDTIESTSFGGSVFIGSNATSAGYVEFDSWTEANLSCKALNPYTSGTLAGSKFIQNANANMPWKGAQHGGIQGDGTGDQMESNSAVSNWRYLHDGTGGTVALLLRSEGNTPNASAIFDSMRINTTRTGTHLTYDSRAVNHKFIVSIGNGSGVYAFTGSTPSGMLSPGAWGVVVLRTSSTHGVDLRVNGVSQLSGPLVNPSLNDSDYNLNILGIGGGGSWINGNVRKIMTANAHLDGAELAQLESYMMRAAK